MSGVLRVQAFPKEEFENKGISYDKGKLINKRGSITTTSSYIHPVDEELLVGYETSYKTIQEFLELPGNAFSQEKRFAAYRLKVKTLRDIVKQLKLLVRHCKDEPLQYALYYHYNQLNNFLTRLDWGNSVVFISLEE